jgi:hypothetical protein
MIKQVFMVSTVIVLIFLIIITPTFISQQAPIGSFPRVLIDHMDYSVLVDVRAALEDYRYHNITIRVAGIDNPGYHPPPVQSSETYGIQATILKNDTREFALNITLFDQGGQGYDYNSTVRIVSGQDGDDMVIMREGSSQNVQIPIGEYFRDTFIARSVS